MRGIYVCCKFNEEDCEALHELVKDIPGEVMDPKKYHTTIIYSRTYDDVALPGKLAISMMEDTVFKGVEFFDSGALVMTTSNKSLDELHTKMMSEYDLTFDYPDYAQHITLAYDVDKDQVDVEALKQKLKDVKLRISKFEKEDLDLNAK
jgi:2'-5' RNA ligase